MARQTPTKTKKEQNGATVGFEQKLWQAADTLRNLANLRVPLLPTLISGELRMKNGKAYRKKHL
jgi:hypothetical protein